MAFHFPVERLHKLTYKMKRDRTSRLEKRRKESVACLVAERDYPRLLKYKLEELFPESSIRVRVRGMLEDYGVKPGEAEPERVRLVILKLGGTDIREIARTVEGAKENYEDILDWAERPEETKGH